MYLCTLYTAECPEDDEDDESPLHKALEFCSYRSKSIEILYENPSKTKILTKVYFQLDPEVSNRMRKNMLTLSYIHIHAHRPGGILSYPLFHSRVNSGMWW